MEDFKLPLDRLSQWIYAVCTINFDVDFGQTLESIYPLHIKLTKAERRAISYLAFPDSQTSCEENTQHHFRFKCTSISSLLLKSFSLFYKYYPPSLSPVFDSCFGYAFFKQKKDLTQKRHYSQKTLVVLSPLPFDAFFYEITRSISEAYFSCGIRGIAKAIEEIDLWPAPKVNEKLVLPLLGITYFLHIPKAVGTVAPTPQPTRKESEQDPSATSSFSTSQSLSSLAEGILDCFDQSIFSKSSEILGGPSTSTNSESSYDFVPDNSSLVRVPAEVELSLESRAYVRAFAPVLAHLQRLWELTITAQPLLVMAPNPGQASQAVQALVSCIAPFAFSADYRPFFTIYDTEFKEVSRSCTSSPITILGVTNPFFTKALHHWPNVVCIGHVKHMERKKRLHHLSSRVLFEGLKPGLYSRYKPFLKKDLEFFRRLKKALTDGTSEEYISRGIQQFFHELTMSFLIPLEHYLSNLMPLHRYISPFRCVPELNRFDMSDFLRTLGTAGPRLTCDIKGDWIGLYKSFFSGPHFIHWLSQREKEIGEKLHSLHLDAVLEANFDSWMQKRTEVEIVDMILRLEQMMARHGHANCKIEGIRKQIAVLLEGLPEDLRQEVGRSVKRSASTFVTVNKRG